MAFSALADALWVMLTTLFLKVLPLMTLAARTSFAWSLVAQMISLPSLSCSLNVL
ncbi:hypothetical protein ACFY2R_22075 [Micromonospora olivasterospora]|uniref:hypothetical protein n=1 Tax=Micromonospora olivasterospora TaxID=1880 RepID=UPI0014792F4A|nr:hypothetical protein [Micromonospora olivasterospora]